MERSAGILFLNNGSVLMGHATETPHWDIPKGHIEKGESPINAAIRECFEETGVVVEQHELLSLGLIDYTSKKSLCYSYMWVIITPKQKNVFALQPSLKTVEPLLKWMTSNMFRIARSAIMRVRLWGIY